MISCIWCHTLKWYNCYYIGGNKKLHFYLSPQPFQVYKALAMATVNLDKPDIIMITLH